MNGTKTLPFLLCACFLSLWMSDLHVSGQIPTQNLELWLDAATPFDTNLGGIEFWPEFKGRDGCRTPMVWEAMPENSGFSNATPWLPVSPDQQQLAVSEQEQVKESMLNHYRQVIRLRHQHAPLATGSLEICQSEGALLGFLRQTDQETLYCVFNFSDEALDTSLPAGNWSDIGEVVGGAPIPGDGSLRLGAWQCAIVRKRGGNNG